MTPKIRDSIFLFLFIVHIITALSCAVVSQRVRSVEGKKVVYFSEYSLGKGIDFYWCFTFGFGLLARGVLLISFRSVLASIVFDIFALKEYHSFLSLILFFADVGLLAFDYFSDRSSPLRDYRINLDSKRKYDMPNGDQFYGTRNDFNDKRTEFFQKQFEKMDFKIDNFSGNMADGFSRLNHYFVRPEPGIENQEGWPHTAMRFSEDHKSEQHRKIQKEKKYKK